MQIMASTVPDKARKRAAMGNSYDPGTDVSKIFSGATLHSSSAVRIPLTKLLTCPSFQRVRIMPMRTLLPSKSEKETSLSAAYHVDLILKNRKRGNKQQLWLTFSR